MCSNMCISRIMHHQNQDSCSNGIHGRLLWVGMWPNIVLIGRALYLTVREAVKSTAVSIRRGAQLDVFFINAAALIYVFALCFHQGTSP